MAWDRASLFILIPFLILIYLFSLHRLHGPKGLLLRALLIVVLCWAISSPFFFITVKNQVQWIFILDNSASMSRQEWESMISLAKERMLEARDKGYKVQLIRMGKTSQMIRELPKLWNPENGSDLRGSLQLALGLASRFDGSNYFFLFTDASAQNYPEDIVVNAKSLSIPIITWHPPCRDKELVVLGLDVPSSVREGEPVPIHLSYISNFEGEGKVIITAWGKEYLEKKVHIKKTKDGLLDIEGPPLLEGAQALWAYVKGDMREENNRAFAMPYISPCFSVLMIGEDKAFNLARALTVQGIKVDIIPSSQFYPRFLNNKDLKAFIIASPLQIKEKDLDPVLSYKKGILFLGKQLDSPSYFPVSQIPPKNDIKPPQKPKQTPPPVPPETPAKKIKAPIRYKSASVIFLIDRSGSMEGDKIKLAKIATLASIRMLWPEDYVGVIAFDSEAEWIVPLRHPTDQVWIDELVMRINAGGNTDIYPALEKASQALLNVDTHIKHVILLSDGMSESRYQILNIVPTMTQSNITISTIGIGEDFDYILMPRIARLGQGRFYFTDSFLSIPQLMTNDVERILGPLDRYPQNEVKNEEREPVKEKTPSLPPPIPPAQPDEKAEEKKESLIEAFNVIKANETHLLKPFNEFPSISQYEPYRLKKGAEVSLLVKRTDELLDPLLIHWQWKLGKVMVWAGEVDEWIEWYNYPKFWSRILRFLAASPLDGPISTDLKLKRNGKEALIKVKARLASGEIVPGLEADSNPPLAKINQDEWEGHLDLKEIGQIYKVKIRFHKDNEEMGIVEGGIVVPYENEVNDLNVQTDLLEKMTNTTLKSHEPKIIKQPIDWYFLLAGIILIALEMILRGYFSFKGKNHGRTKTRIDATA